MTAQAVALPAPTAPAADGLLAIGPRRLLGFFAMVLGMFMAILDIQIVSASIADIQAGLAASPDEASWVQTSYLIADGSELDPAWLAGVKTAGLTAGASAPEELVLDVIEALRRHGPVEVDEMDGVSETLEFRLPKELRGPVDGMPVVADR